MTNVLLIQIQPWHSEVIVPFLQLYKNSACTIYYPTMKENSTDCLGYYLDQMKPGIDRSSQINIIDRPLSADQLKQHQQEADLIIYITIPFGQTKVLYPHKTWVIVHCPTHFQQNPAGLNYMSLTPLIKRPLPPPQGDTYDTYWYAKEPLPDRGQQEELPVILPIVRLHNPCQQRLPHIVVIGMSEYYSQNGKDLYGLFALAERLMDSPWQIIIYTRDNPSLLQTAQPYPNVSVKQGVSSASMIEQIRQASFITTCELTPHSIYTDCVFSGSLSLVFNHQIPVICSQKMARIYGLDHALTYQSDLSTVASHLLHIDHDYYTARHLTPLLYDRDKWLNRNQHTIQNLRPTSQSSSHSKWLVNHSVWDGLMQSVLILHQTPLQDAPLIVTKYNYSLDRLQAYKRLQDLYYTFYQWKIVLVVERARIPEILTWARILHYRLYVHICEGPEDSLSAEWSRPEFWSKYRSLTKNMIIMDDQAWIINYRDERTDIADKIHSLLTSDSVNHWGHPQFYYWQTDRAGQLMTYQSELADQSYMPQIILQGHVPTKVNGDQILLVDTPSGADFPLILLDR